MRRLKRLYYLYDSKDHEIDEEVRGLLFLEFGKTAKDLWEIYDTTKKKEPGHM